MPSYTYSRTELTTGVYYDTSIPNSGGSTIVSVVQAAFPSYSFTTELSGTDIIYNFTETLTAGEITTLGSTHTGFTPSVMMSGYSDGSTTGISAAAVVYGGTTGETGSTTGGVGGQLTLQGGAGGGGSSTSGTGGAVQISGGLSGSTGSGGVGGAIIFSTAGTTSLSERMRITKDGYVGIGDSSPTTALSIGMSGAFQVNSSGNLAKINMVSYTWPSSQGSNKYVLSNNGSGTLSWSSVGSLDALTGTGMSGAITYFNGMSTVTYDSNFSWDATNDRLGIGTSMPSCALHVINSSSANFRLGQSSTTYTDFVSSSTGGLTVTTVGTSGAGGVTFTIGSNSMGDGGDFVVTAGATTMGIGGDISLTCGNSGMSNVGGAVSLTAGTGGSSGATGGAVTLTAGVGGASTSTGGALNLKAGLGGSSGAGGAIVFETAATNSRSERARIDKDGKFGIGATAPAARLEVETITTEATAAILIDQNDTDQPVIKFEGQESANATDTISTHATAGTIAKWLQINVNGTKYWLPVYNDPTA